MNLRRAIFGAVALIIFSYPSASARQVSPTIDDLISQIVDAANYASDLDHLDAAQDLADAMERDRRSRPVLSLNESQWARVLPPVLEHVERLKAADEKDVEWRVPYREPSVRILREGLRQGAVHQLGLVDRIVALDEPNIRVRSPEFWPGGVTIPVVIEVPSMLVGPAFLRKVVAITDAGEALSTKPGMAWPPPIDVMSYENYWLISPPTTDGVTRIELQLTASTAVDRASPDDSGYRVLYTRHHEIEIDLDPRVTALLQPTNSDEFDRQLEEDCFVDYVQGTRGARLVTIIAGEAARHPLLKDLPARVTLLIGDEVVLGTTHELRSAGHPITRNGKTAGERTLEIDLRLRQQHIARLREARDAAIQVTMRIEADRLAIANSREFQGRVRNWVALSRAIRGLEKEIELLDDSSDPLQRQKAALRERLVRFQRAQAEFEPLVFWDGVAEIEVDLGKLQ